MKLYDYFRSTACYRVRIALNLKNISYTKLSINLLHEGGEQFLPSYQAINPQSLVPTLDENGHILTQSLAIIEYLEEICPDPPLLPSTPLARSMVRSIAQSIACDIHPLNNLRVLQRLRSQFAAEESQITNWYHHWLKVGFDSLEKRLENLSRKNAVCFGSDVTLADVYLIPQVYNAKRFDFSLNPYPCIQEINEYCLSLAAFADAAPEQDR